jgi:hypothetical protein
MYQLIPSLLPNLATKAGATLTPSRRDDHSLTSNFQTSAHIAGKARCKTAETLAVSPVKGYALHRKPSPIYSTPIVPSSFLTLSIGANNSCFIFLLQPLLRLLILLSPPHLHLLQLLLATLLKSPHSFKIFWRNSHKPQLLLQTPQLSLFLSTKRPRVVAGPEVKEGDARSVVHVLDARKVVPLRTVNILMLQLNLHNLPPVPHPPLHSHSSLLIHLTLCRPIPCHKVRVDALRPI